MFGGLVSVYVFLSIIAFYKWFLYAKDKQFLDMCSWSVIGRSMGQTSYVRDQVIEVFNAQFDNDIEEQYRLSYEKDYEIVVKIVKDFQLDFMRSFFHGRRLVVKSKYSIYPNVYFILALYIFLCDHQYDYSETDKKLVYRKVNYITYMYCKNNKALQNYVPSWNERCLRESIDEVLVERS